MKIKFLFIINCILLTASVPLYAQVDFVLYQQFNGRYDFTFIGNTMNEGENNLSANPCVIHTSSSATLHLQESDQIEKAFLYWSGSGTGDFEIKLNDIDIETDRHFNISYINPAIEGTLFFFSAFADVTDQVLSTGNGIYTVSELDVSDLFEPPQTSLYCRTATNYAGWALVVVYKNNALPLNQLNVYDGLQRVPDEVTITLDNLNVIDNQGAKIGFVAWEGDSTLDDGESLLINGNILSNELNPATNAFNSTNTFTGSTQLYNMDLDVYDIQDYININDTTAQIKLTSNADLVLISTVVTKLNSQLPDATITIDQIQTFCNSYDIEIEYTVYNTDATDILPANTPISVYINDVFMALTHTQDNIPINGSENGSIIISVPENFTEDINLVLIVDDNNGTGIVTEINEDNNISNPVLVQLWFGPDFNPPEDLVSCNTGNQTATFDFSQHEYTVKQNDSDTVSFHSSYEDAWFNLNPISDILSYTIQTFPKEIFVRIDDGSCFSITSFFLHITNCPPTVYNGISVNNDGYNDEFFIEGLYGIFEDFELFVYSRWGILIWKGNNNTPKWKGEITRKNPILSEDAPEGTYFYILELNDKDYPNPLQGYLYLTR